jgi:ligand-binding sensor domain-containing protein
MYLDYKLFMSYRNYFIILAASLLCLLVGSRLVSAAGNLPPRQWQHFTTADGLQSDSITVVQTDDTGDLWIGYFATGVSRKSGSEWSHFAVADGLGSDFTRSLATVGDEIWVGHFGAGLSRFNGATWTTVMPSDGLLDGSVNAMIERTDGVVLIGHYPFGTAGQGGGISIFDGGYRSLLSTQRLTNMRAIMDFDVDKLGNTWIAASEYSTYLGLQSGGLGQLQGEHLQVYTMEDGLPSNTVTAVATTKDGVWVGTDAGLVLFDGKDFKPLSADNRLIDDHIQALAVDHDGSLWIGTPSGVNHITTGGYWETYTTETGLLDNSINDIAIDADGTVWFATDKGLSALLAAGQTPPPPPQHTFYFPIFY